jgi:hypothetical protein
MEIRPDTEADPDKPVKELPPNCFSESTYKTFSFFFKMFENDSKIGKAWFKIRCFANDLAEHENFELFIIIMILLSSIALVS